MAEQDDGVVLDVPMEEIAPDNECKNNVELMFIDKSSFLVEEIRKAAAKKKGRGFETSHKSNVETYETLEDDGFSGPQRSVEV
jgi:hypothetical protein